MSFRERNKSFFDTISIAILVSISLLLSLRIFPIALFLLPIPFVVLGVNHKEMNTILGMVLLSLILGFVMDFYSGLIILVGFLPMTYCLTSFINKKYEPRKVILYTMLVFLITILALVYIGFSSMDVNFSEELSKLLDTGFDMELENFKALNLTKTEMANLGENLDVLKDIVLETIPSVIIILSAFVIYINYSISLFVLRKEGYKVGREPRFSQFKLPKTIFLGLFLMYIVLKLSGLAFNINQSGVMNNTIILSVFAFSLQGFSVLDHIMIKRGRKFFTRLVLIFIMMFLLPLGSFMSFVGILDVFFDFRKPKRLK